MGTINLTQNVFISVIFLSPIERALMEERTKLLDENERLRKQIILNKEELMQKDRDYQNLQKIWAKMQETFEEIRISNIK